MPMKTLNEQPAVSSEAHSDEIDFSDLLGVDQAFLARPDAERQAALIDAYCNKIGDESGISRLD